MVAAIMMMMFMMVMMIITLRTLVLDFTTHDHQDHDDDDHHATLDVCKHMYIFGSIVWSWLWYMQGGDCALEWLWLKWSLTWSFFLYQNYDPWHDHDYDNGDADEEIMTILVPLQEQHLASFILGTANLPPQLDLYCKPAKNCTAFAEISNKAMGNVLSGRFRPILALRLLKRPARHVCL